MSKIMTVLKIAFSIIVIVTTTAGGTAAMAQGKGGSDVFNRSTGGAGGISTNRPISGNAALGNNGPIPRWFDDMDGAFYDYGYIKSEDTLLLNRPFDKNAKRLKEWTKAASATAVKYHDYAHALRALKIPPGLGSAGSELTSYRNATADYYDDCGDYFEDWVKPRQPAVTREDLQDQLREMHDRAEGLKRQINNLLVIDKQLRTKYEVRDREDALMRYVAKAPAKQQ